MNTVRKEIFDSTNWNGSCAVKCIFGSWISALTAYNHLLETIYSLLAQLKICTHILFCSSLKNILSKIYCKVRNLVI